jgi:hypothetical protein
MGTERIIAMSHHEPRPKLAIEFSGTEIVTEPATTAWRGSRFGDGVVVLSLRRGGDAVFQSEDAVAVLVPGAHGRLDAAVGEETAKHDCGDPFGAENEVEVGARERVEPAFPSTTMSPVCGASTSTIAAPQLSFTKAQNAPTRTAARCLRRNWPTVGRTHPGQALESTPHCSPASPPVRSLESTKQKCSNSLSGTKLRSAK